METEALLVMLVRTPLLLELLLAMLDTTDELPNGAGSPLAGDCRICTGGRIVLGTLADTDEEVLLLLLLLLVALDVAVCVGFSAEPGAWLIGFFWF